VIEDRLQRYLDHLSPELLRAVGADRFPPYPIIRLVPESRR
jgi:hypothetical protein